MIMDMDKDGIAVLDNAWRALTRLANMAVHMSLFMQSTQSPNWKLCKRLGGEFLQASEFIRTLESGHPKEKIIEQAIPRFLGQVEMTIVPSQEQERQYPFIRSLGIGELDSTERTEARQTLSPGLLKVMEGKVEHIQALIKLVKDFGAGERPVPPVVDEVSAPPQGGWTDSSCWAEATMYRVMLKHVYCDCSDHQESQVGSSSPEMHHLVRLLLRPSLKRDSQENMQYDILFSSSHPIVGKRPFHWQVTELLVPRSLDNEKDKKRPDIIVTSEAGCLPDHGKAVNGTDQPALRTQCSTHQAPDDLKIIRHGDFCGLLSKGLSTRLHLVIRDGELGVRSHETLPERFPAQAPSISFADLVQNYQLNIKMKGILAFILARSVWQLYDSDLMKTPWTRDTIHFVKERTHSTSDIEAGIYVSKPYLSVRFDQSAGLVSDYTDAVGEFLRYPRVRALGIMLVEIGLGRLLIDPRSTDPQQSPMQRSTKEMILAMDEADKTWPQFDFGRYKAAVKPCFDQDIFKDAPFVPESQGGNLAEGIERRRRILYDKVVLQLEEFLKGTGWQDDLERLEPLKRQKAPSTSLPNSIATPSAGKKALTDSQKASTKWLNRIYRLHVCLDEGPASRTTLFSQAPRIKIAILDTGCDEQASWFTDTRYDRLREWKDFVDGSGKRVDVDGHGTHLVSLIMKIAPHADICVARVSKDAKSLDSGSENVAEAIAWAHETCKADIVSMSFGYNNKQPRIGQAIERALFNTGNTMLFFAAANNDGANRREMFPARHKDVISIHATDGNGAVASFSPAPGSEDPWTVATLGVDLPGSSLGYSLDPHYITGTSAANAVAVGLAGMLLGLANHHRTKVSFRETFERLHSGQGMRALFLAISKDAKSGEKYRYVAPWALEGKTDEQRWAFLENAVSEVD